MPTLDECNAAALELQRERGIRRRIQAEQRQQESGATPRTAPPPRSSRRLVGLAPSPVLSKPRPTTPTVRPKPPQPKVAKTEPQPAKGPGKQPNASLTNLPTAPVVHYKAKSVLADHQIAVSTTNPQTPPAPLLEPEQQPGPSRPPGADLFTPPSLQTPDSDSSASDPGTEGYALKSPDHQPESPGYAAMVSDKGSWAIVKCFEKYITPQVIQEACRYISKFWGRLAREPSLAS